VCFLVRFPPCFGKDFFSFGRVVCVCDDESMLYISLRLTFLYLSYLLCVRISNHVTTKLAVMQRSASETITPTSVRLLLFECTATHKRVFFSLPPYT